MASQLRLAFASASQILNLNAVQRDALRLWLNGNPAELDQTPPPRVIPTFADVIARIAADPRFQGFRLEDRHRDRARLALREWADEIASPPTAPGRALALHIEDGLLVSDVLDLPVVNQGGCEPEPRRGAIVDLATFVAILSLLIAVLSYAHDKQSDGNSISHQDAQELVEQAIRAVQAAQPPGER